MFICLPELLIIVCFALSMAATPARSADPDKTRADLNASGSPLSAAPEPAGETSKQPMAQTGNAAPAAQDKPGDTSREGEQAASPSTRDAGKTGGDTAVAAPSPAGKGATVKIRTHLNDSTCSLLKAAAAAHGLPLEFFARVIWTESRFKPNAIGPTTRTGHRAQGIAQFMPYTASARGLADPFDPELALPEAAEFLAELRGEFGNLGLAAAAYNAGPGRVHKFLNKQGGMPAETRYYVRAITGRTVEDWAARGREARKKGAALPTSCRVLAALVKERPGFSIGTIDRKLHEAAIGLIATLDLPPSAAQAESSAALQQAKGSAALQIKHPRNKRTWLTNLSPRLGLRPANRMKLLKSSARRWQSAVATRFKGKRARRSLRAVMRGRTTISDDRINKIMRICNGCLPPQRAVSKQPSKRLSRSAARTRLKATPRTKRIRAVVRRRLQVTAKRVRDDRIDKIMRICNGC
jgi:soluble lytic murein transglycosylase-like protein